MVRLHLVIYHYHHSLAAARYLEQKKSNLQNTTRARIRKSGEMQTVLEQFAIVRRIRRLLREEVDDKRGDVSSKEQAEYQGHQ